MVLTQPSLVSSNTFDSAGPTNAPAIVLLHGSLVIPGCQATCVFQAMHLSVQSRTAFLHPPVVTTADNFAIEYQDRTNRDATLSQFS